MRNHYPVEMIFYTRAPIPIAPRRARRPNAVAVAMSALLSAACGGGTASAPDDDDVTVVTGPGFTTEDATLDPETASAPLDGQVRDASEVDIVFPDLVDGETDTRDAPSSMVGLTLAVTLQTGERVEGEVIAVYDQRRWWTPEDGVVLALFDASRFPASPDDWASDSSVRVVASRDVVRLDTIPPKAPSFEEFARAEGLWPEAPMDGVAYVMAGSERHHKDENGFGDFAFDLGRADAGGRWQGDGLDVSDYLSWDVPIHAPRGGILVELKDDEPDRPIDPSSAGDGADLLDLEENLVGLWLAGRYYLYFLHLREGSLDPTLEPGQRIEAGQALGRIGNSGTSLEPHLHYVLLFHDAAMQRSFSVPLRFSAVHVGAAPTGGVAMEEAAPFGGTWLSNDPF